MVQIVHQLASKAADLIKQGEEFLAAMETCGWPDVRPSRIKEHVEDVVNTTDDILADRGEMLVPESVRITFELLAVYDKWYSGCLGLITANMASRMNDYVDSNDHARKILMQDYFTKEDQHSVARCVQRGNAIVHSLPAYVSAAISDMQIAVAGEFVGAELDELDVLNDLGHTRAAGAVAGVLLERYLKTLCDKHQPPIRYHKRDGIGKLNDKLKDAQAYEIIQWRKVQWMGDVRNKCDHAGELAPTKEEVAELITDLRRFVAHV